MSPPAFVPCNCIMYALVRARCDGKIDHTSTHSRGVRARVHRNNLSATAVWRTDIIRVYACACTSSECITQWRPGATCLIQLPIKWPPTELCARLSITSAVSHPFAAQHTSIGCIPHVRPSRGESDDPNSLTNFSGKKHTHTHTHFAEFSRTIFAVERCA